MYFGVSYKQCRSDLKSLSQKIKNFKDSKPGIFRRKLKSINSNKVDNVLTYISINGYQDILSKYRLFFVYLDDIKNLYYIHGYRKHERWMWNYEFSFAELLFAYFVFYNCNYVKDSISKDHLNFNSLIYYTFGHMPQKRRKHLSRKIYNSSYFSNKTPIEISNNWYFITLRAIIRNFNLYKYTNNKLITLIICSKFINIHIPCELLFYVGEFIAKYVSVSIDFMSETIIYNIKEKIKDNEFISINDI